MSLPNDAVGWPAVCDCNIFWSYSLFPVIVLISVLKIDTVRTVSSALL